MLDADPDKDDTQDDYEDEKMYERDDPVIPQPDNSVQESKNKGAAIKSKEIHLPPKDGSLKFAGPQNDRQKEVVGAFQHAWKGYKTYAWGHDHLRPISRGAQNWFVG